MQYIDQPGASPGSWVGLDTYLDLSCIQNRLQKYDAEDAKNGASNASLPKTSQRPAQDGSLMAVMPQQLLQRESEGYLLLKTLRCLQGSCQSNSLVEPVTWSQALGRGICNISLLHHSEHSGSLVFPTDK